MSLLGLLLIIVVIALLIGGLPQVPWGYSRHVAFAGSYGAPGLWTVVLIIVIVLLLTGRL